jgi:hypothetical protein
MSVTDPAPPPTLQSSKLPTYAGRGYAEIKPHNVPNIRAGLKRLRQEYAERAGQPKAPRPGRPKRVPPAPAVDKQVYLLTYDHHLTRTPGGSTIVIYLLRPHQTVLTGPEPNVTGLGRQSWLDGLGEWWSLGNLPGPEYALGQWQDLVGPTVFGSMIEPFVRREFFKQFGQPKEHTSKVHRPHMEGVDVHWQEVAEFLYELAAELGEAA